MTIEWSHLQLGLSFAAARDFSRARKVLQSVLQVEPHCAEALNGIGVVSHGERHIEAASESYRAAMKADPLCSKPVFNLALLLYERQELDYAAVIVENAIQLNKSPPYLCLRGIVSCLRGDYLTAVPYLDACLDIDRYFIVAYYYRGVAMATCGRMGEAANDFNQAAQSPELSHACHSFAETGKVAKIQLLDVV